MMSVFNCVSYHTRRCPRAHAQGNRIKKLRHPKEQNVGAWREVPAAGSTPNAQHPIQATPRFRIQPLGIWRWALGVGRWALGVGRWALNVLQPPRVFDAIPLRRNHNRVDILSADDLETRENEN